MMQNMAEWWDHLPSLPSNISFRRKQSEKVRVINDLSHPIGHSINSGNDHEYCRLTYESVDDVVHKCQEIGDVDYLAKLDLANAFKSINVCPEDWYLLRWMLDVDTNKAMWPCIL